MAPIPPWPRRSRYGVPGSIAGDDNFGCCGLVQGLRGLLQLLLLPRSGGFPAEKYGRTGPPRGAVIRSAPPVARELRLHPAAAARNSPHPCSSSSQVGRRGSSRDVGISSDSSPVSRELRFADQEEDLRPVARNSTAVRGDLFLCSSSSRDARRTGPAPDVVETSSAPPVARELRLPPAAAARNSPHPCSSSSQVGRRGSSRDVGISSDSSPVSRELRFADQEEDLRPVARDSTAVRGDLFLCSSSSRGARRTGPAPDVVETSSDEDDCVILDSDPHGAVAVKDGRESGGGDGGSDEELQIVGEKGQVACRDFPHSRHLCSNMPFGTTSHERHCTMCYCFVCDVHAPCGYWGKGLSVDDHCHATDKESKWKTLRQVFRCSNLPASHPQNEISQSLALTASVPRPYSATRVQSGTSNGHTAQVTRLIEPTVSAPRPHSATGAVRGTSDVHTAQISHRLALTVSAPRASSATRVQSGASNGHSAQVTHLVEATVNAPRSHPEAGAGRGTSNTHTALITRPSEPTVSAARPYSAARTGRGTSNACTSQITRPVEQTVGAPRVYPAAGAGRDSSNAHSSQITYPAIANGYLPEPDAPEGATVYVGNLPYHIDNERLKLSFQHAGVVLFSKVIYDRETGKSRGSGFVTMNTVQEAEAAVRMYHGSVVYGRPLTVNIAAPRGSARVGHQSGSPLKLFVCNLPTQVDHSRLKELFSKHGKVVDARVVYERRGEDWCSRGFGFVTMATKEEAHNAIRALNKQVLEGNPLGVKVARERPERGCPSPSNQIPLQNAAGRSQDTHTSVRASPNVAPTVSVPRAYPASRARSSTTSNAHTAQVTHRLDPTRSN